MRNRISLLLIMFFCAFSMNAQNAVDVDTLLRISGKVIDAYSGERLREAEIHVNNNNVSTMTNEDGFFMLKAPKNTSGFSVSALGYHTHYVSVASLSSTEDMKILLKPDAKILEDVQVYSAENIVEAALLKIPSNYPSVSMIYSTFYRETVKKRNRYVSVIEAVQDVYKKSYQFDNPEEDKVYVLKGRRLLSEHRKDTIAVHVEGGPNEALFLDLVKNRDFFLNVENLEEYGFWLENSRSIGDRMHYVVGFRPLPYMQHEIEYTGLMYIDAQTLAFSRIELSLDCSDKQKASDFMLRHKPFGLRFRPESLKTVINYYYDGNISHINYIRNTFQFGCDWKKRGLYTHYVVTSENLVTKRETTTSKPARKPSFGRYDVLDKKVGNFEDVEFWKDYNILEPSESLENAVRKLVKRAGE